MRAPSSFHSTAADPVRPIASVTVSAVCASIGFTGRSTSSRKRSSPGLPSASAASATGGSSPASIERAPNVDRGNLGRLRDRVDHDPLERSLAELAVEDARGGNVCSRSVASAKTEPSSPRRVSCEPRPDDTATRRRAASTSRTSSEACGVGSAGRGATPIRPRSAQAAREERHRRHRTSSARGSRRHVASRSPPSPNRARVSETSVRRPRDLVEQHLHPGEAECAEVGHLAAQIRPRPPARLHGALRWRRREPCPRAARGRPGRPRAGRSDLQSSPAPFAFTVTMPPPAEASRTSPFASSWARTICSCICCACFISAFMSSFMSCPPLRLRRGR